MRLARKKAAVPGSTDTARSEPASGPTSHRVRRLLLLAAGLAAVLSLPLAAFGQSPTVQLLNLSRPGMSDFYVGDSWRIAITGPPFQEVVNTATQNGSPPSSSPYGYTDASGNFTLEGSMPDWAIGVWTETWSVGGVPASPSLVFEVRALPVACGVSITPNPLSLVSVDFYDYFTGEYRYTQPGSGIMSALSPFPHCVQTGFQVATDPPLALLDYGPVFQYTEYWLEQFLFGDTGQLWVIPFYPYTFFGGLYVQGIDLTSGQPFSGNGWITLTVFQQYI